MKKLFTIIFYFIFFLFLFSCSSTRKSQQEKGFKMMEEVNIGGINQAVMIKGKSRKNPVLLRLHGGPGFPLLPYIPKKGKLKKLQKHYTVVYWEQRGTGKSYHNNIPDSTMNTEQFIKDTYEVVQYIKEKLKVDKVYIWGHSWGSNIGILFSEKYPDQVHAYIGTGQSVCLVNNEKNAYHFALNQARQKNNEKALKELQAIDTSNYELKDALTVRKWLNAFGGIVHNEKIRKQYINKKVLKQIWSTPEYTFGEKIRICLHPLYSGKKLWNDMKKINLYKQAPKLDVPVYFMLGKYDEIVSHEIAADYFHKLKAPKGKKLIWFKNSAHRPFLEQPDKFVELMTEKVLEETYPSYSKQHATKSHE